jgi:hypothetical protein
VRFGVVEAINGNVRVLIGCYSPSELINGISGNCPRPSNCAPGNSSDQTAVAALGAATGNRGRGHTNMRHLLLKAQRMAVTNTEYVAFQKIRKAV